MFEKITLRRSEQGPPLSAGELAEALLFYQNVHIILDFASLNALINQIGMPTLVALISRPNVSAVYCKDSPAIHTETKNNVETHSFITFGFAGNKGVGPLNSNQQLLEHILISRHNYPKRQAKKYVERFRRKVRFRTLSENHFIEGGIIKAAKQDLSDDSLIKKSVRIALTEIVGADDIPDDYYFKVNANNTDFRISTNLNFQDINMAIKKRDPKAHDLSPAHLIGSVFDARADVILASFYGGEFYTSNLTSTIIRLKYSELLRRIGIEKNELKEFFSIVVCTGPSLREVINLKQQTFDDFLVMLDKSQPFKEWLKGINPDEKLVTEYFNEVSSQSWIQKIPSKIIRYAVTTVASVANPLAGAAVSAADFFLSEKIFDGWRPNHFVEQKFKPFIDNDN